MTHSPTDAAPAIALYATPVIALFAEAWNDVLQDVTFCSRSGPFGYPSEDMTTKLNCGHTTPQQQCCCFCLKSETDI